MIATSLNLLNFLVRGGFLYPRTPAELINRRLGYTVRGGIEAGGQMKCPRSAGLGHTKKKVSSSASCPIVF